MRCARSSLFHGTGGVTLIELMIVVAIIGILAAVGIPTMTRQIKESRISEATTNIQGIIIAEQAYFSSVMMNLRYTAALPFCPAVPAPSNRTQNWTRWCAGQWDVLGWQPDKPVYFQYRVASHTDGVNNDNLPAVTGTLCPAGINPCDATSWAINWGAVLGGGVVGGYTVAATTQPWFVVEARGDTDGDLNWVFIRANSVNQKSYRSPDENSASGLTW